MQNYQYLCLTSLMISGVIFCPITTINKFQQTSLLANTFTKQTDNEKLAQQLTNSYLNKIPINNNPNLTLEQAREVQNQFVQNLVPNLGRIVGYKAALTNQQAQKRFQISHPLQGVILEKMLLKNGAVIPANFGTIPMVEGDLMVRVGSEDINTATTLREILASLDAVIPFLELPDLLYGQHVQLDAPALLAINVGARLGVLGEPIPLANTDDWEKRLGNIKLVILDQDKNQLAIGESNALLGHPLQVVTWLRDELKRQGKSLKKGDLLSLGTITPMMPVKSGMTIKAQYFGLDIAQPVEISVSFE